MPAAAVIPAPKAYTNAVAVKKLVVGFRVEGLWRLVRWLGFGLAWRSQVQPPEFAFTLFFSELLGRW